MSGFREYMQKFCDAEQTHHLFAILSHNYPLWYGLRTQIFRKYLVQQAIFSDNQVITASKPRTLSWKQLRWILAPWFQAKTYRRLFSRHKYLIVQHERKQRGVDIYTEHPRQQLGNEALVISFSEYCREPSAEGIDLDLFRLFAKIIAIGGARWFKPATAPQMRGFFKELGMDPTKHSWYISKHTIEFTLMFYFFRGLLYFTRPQLVFLAVGYNNTSLIAAAKSYGIPTVEMQHGTIFPYHLGYRFPHTTQTEFFPDHLLLFSPFWQKGTPLPPDCHLFPIGNDYLHSPLSRQSKAKSIVFISQSTIGGFLEQFLLNNRDILEDYTVYFKLHPKEFQALPKIYPRLLQMAHPNLQIITAERTVADLHKECTYQIGVFSTAIFEGLQSGCYTILLDVPGVEHMETLIQQGYAHLVKVESSLKEALPHSKSSREFPQFFELFSPSRWQQWLSAIESQGE